MTGTFRTELGSIVSETITVIDKSISELRSCALPAIYNSVLIGRFHGGVDVSLGLLERCVGLLGVLGAADGAAAGAIGLGDLRPLVGGIVGALELVVIGVKLGELGLAVGLEERLEGLLPLQEGPIVRDLCLFLRRQPGVGRFDLLQGKIGLAFAVGDGAEGGDLRRDVGCAAGCREEVDGVGHIVEAFHAALEAVISDEGICALQEVAIFNAADRVTIAVCNRDRDRAAGRVRRSTDGNDLAGVIAVLYDRRCSVVGNALTFFTASVL